MEKVPATLSAFLLFQMFSAGLLSPCLQAAPNTVWQIGKFDQSPVEFLGAPKKVNYDVGKSDWHKDWPALQPVDQPYHVAFDLASVQDGYILRIGLLIEKPRVPTLQIEVNGHSGVFYLHPKLSYSRSDFTYAFDPHEAQSELRIAVPAHFLHAGQNSLTITSVDDPVSNADEQNDSE